MAQITDGFKDIFLAGIGAMAVTGEKAKELVDGLIQKGELTVEQGKQVNSELTHKASEKIDEIGADVLERFMGALSPEQRVEFAQKAAEYAAKGEVAEPAAAEGSESACADGKGEQTA